MKKFFSMIAIAILATVLFASCSSDSPSDVVKTYYKAVATQDYDKAMSLVVNKDNEPMSEEERQQIKALLEEKADKSDSKNELAEYANVEIVSETIDPEDENKATVEVKAGENTEKTECVKVDGKWYVKMMK